MSRDLFKAAAFTPETTGFGMNPFKRIARLIALQKERRQLADLDQHLLDDIGIDRHKALAEAERPVWDAPGAWFR